jgi:hypothetical protein
MIGQVASLLLAGLGLVSPACGSPPVTGAPMFTDTTVAELRPLAAADRLVAVLRCETIETRLPDSRSERQLIKATLLAGPGGIAPGSTLQLSRYAQGAPLMTVGSAYLVAAYRESPAEPWVLVEHKPVDATQAAATLAAAQAELAKRLR